MLYNSAKINELRELVGSALRLSGKIRLGKLMVGSRLRLTQLLIGMPFGEKTPSIHIWKTTSVPSDAFYVALSSIVKQTACSRFIYI